MAQIIPSKPGFLLDSEWAFILDRDEGQCALISECRARGNVYHCDSYIDIDHKHPRELSGDNSYANLRLLCRNVNRGRPVEPDKKWARKNFWDSEIVPARLRAIQMIAAVDPIEELIPAIREFEDANPDESFRNCLLGGAITLLPGATGTGKTIIMQATLFTVNKVIGPNRPRACHGLWLTTDTTLRDLCAKELEQEAEELGIVGGRPVVLIAGRFSHLVKGPQGADITVACPHMLWEIEGEKRQPSEFEKRRALSQFDFIVFDEADWGNERVREIANLARHAMLFCLTASPPLIDIADKAIAGRFLRRFNIIDQGAVADYRRSVELDGCLKLFNEEEVNAARHESHTVLESGALREIRRRMAPEHTLVFSAILQAIVEADQRETRMKEVVGCEYYSPHVMARLQTIAEIEIMEPQLQQAIDDLYRAGELRNPGWGVSAVYQGHMRRKGSRPRPPEEGDLAAKNDRGWRHPFMISKNAGGRASSESKRVLLMCQVGVRGINNWPVAAVVDGTGWTSHTDIIQLLFGRPIRLPPRLASWLNDPALKEFVTALIYIPSTIYDNPEKRDAIQKARDFIMDMEARINNAGFLTWRDLLEGKKPEALAPDIDPAGPTLTLPEKYVIQDALAGRVAATGILTQQDVESIVPTHLHTVFGDLGAKTTRAVEYGTRLLDPTVRTRELQARDAFDKYEQTPVYVGLRLQPQDRYESDELIRFVRNDPVYSKRWAAYRDRILDGDELMMETLSKQLRRIQEITYREPIRIRRLHGTPAEPGVLREVGNELSGELRTAKQYPENSGGEVHKKTIAASKILFGIEDAHEGGPMDHPAYHIAILGSHRNTIKRMARALMIRDGSFPNLDKFAGWEAGE